ncbi:stage II sporulation protein M [Cohnella endophytica]|uniref:Stage II sporulation protein M n=1 Tax=Cohnella endophytica TaxID=2419778 RepID=A0A494Y318_9BACL|nr:stage II sporulation protein M [Cohnella endophytica]RKP57127.1 stage II sporulation protein M [Cohnella endophytica]
MHIKLWNLSARDNLNLYVFVGVLVIVGAIFGAMLVNALTLEQQQELADNLGAYLSSVKDPQHTSAATSFWDSFWFYGKWLLLIWFLGLSVIGLPLVLVLDFLKGVLIGFAVALLAQQLAWKGVLFFLVATAPQNAIIVPALMIASISAARFAYFVVRERLFRRKGQLMPPFLAHTAVTGMMLLMLIVASLYEAFVSPRILERVAPTSPAVVAVENTTFSSK